MQRLYLNCLYLLMAGCLSAAGCQGSAVRTLEHDRDTGRLTEDEARLWYAADELDRTLQNKGVVYVDENLNRYLQSLAGTLYPEFAGTVKLHALDAPELNAFALPNGSVYLNLGLIARMENEAQLATVIAHELSHYKFQHGLKQRHAADTAAVAGWAVTIFTGIPLSGQLVALGAMSGYSQEAEREADREGFKRISAHGYAPAESVRVFEIMRAEAKALGTNDPWLYSSHPRLTERIETMKSLVSQHAVASGRRYSDRFAAATTGLRARLLEKYLAAHQYKQLIHVLEDSAIRHRYPAHAEYYLGEAYRQRAEEGDSDKAQAAYLNAIEKAPRFAPAYRALGIMRMQQGANSEALRYFESYLELEPDAADIKYIQLYKRRLMEQP